jgi:hypothetical protein
MFRLQQKEAHSRGAADHPGDDALDRRCNAVR